MHLKFLFIGLIFFGFQIKSQTNSFNLQVTPNPCDTGTTIYFTTTGNDTVSLNIFDMLGRTTRSFLQKVMLSNSTYLVYFDTKTLNNGVYFVLLTINTKSIGAKIVVSHVVTSIIPSEKLSKNIMVFPNPAKDILFVETNESVNISIYNNLGQLALQANDVEHSIHIQNLKSGIYHCQIFSIHNQLLKKFKLIKTDN